MSVHRMHVLPDPRMAPRQPLHFALAPAVVGKGHRDFLCGCCGRTLMEHVFYAQVRDMVVRCPDCGSINEVLPASKLD